MAMPSTFLCNLNARGRLRLTGEDRVRFLNGQVTNDVKALCPGTGCYAAFTNNKGKMRADAVILNMDDGLLLDLEPAFDTRLAPDLERYIIADDVQVENVTARWSVFTLVGERAAEVLSQSDFCGSIPASLFEIQPLSKSEFPGGFCLRSRRAVSDAFDLWVDRSTETSLLSRLEKPLQQAGAVVAGQELLEIARVEAGIPRFGVDMDDTTLPPEAGMDEIAISYTKGCYVGQEVISRIKHVGHVNRALVRLRLEGGAVTGISLSSKDREVGKLGSAVTSPRFGRIGLAIVRCEASAPGTVLASPAGEARVAHEFTA